MLKDKGVGDEVGANLLKRYRNTHLYRKCFTIMYIKNLHVLCYKPLFWSYNTYICPFVDCQYNITSPNLHLYIYALILLVFTFSIINSTGTIRISVHSSIMYNYTLMYIWEHLFYIFMLREVELFALPHKVYFRILFFKLVQIYN